VEAKTYLDRKMTRAARRAYRRVQEASLTGNMDHVLGAAVDGSFPKRPALQRAAPTAAPAKKQQTAALPDAAATPTRAERIMQTRFDQLRSLESAQQFAQQYPDSGLTKELQDRRYYLLKEFKVVEERNNETSTYSNRYEHDHKGNVVKSTNLDRSNQESFRTFRYDHRGNKISETYEDGTEYNHQYGSSGERLFTVKRSAFGSSRTSYTYDADGLMVAKETSGSLGNYKVALSYDEQGRILRRVSTGEDGETIEAYQYEKDGKHSSWVRIEDGKQTFRATMMKLPAGYDVTLSAVSDYSASYWQYQLNENGFPVKVVMTSDYGETIGEYDDHGNLIRETSISKDGKNRTVKTLRYIEQKLVLD